MMSLKKKIGDESKLFYSHAKSKKENDDAEYEFEYDSNSILIDQIDKYKKRNQYKGTYCAFFY